jgi:hypothetical protein
MQSVSTRPIELSLRSAAVADAEVPGASAGLQALRVLADRLVELLAAYVPDVTSLGTAQFREQVQQRRDALAHADSDAAIARESRQLLSLCERFLDRVRSYNADRDEELAGVVQVMHDLVDTLRGDARTFQEGLLASSTAIARLADVDDIRELKRALARQAEDLNGRWLRSSSTKPRGSPRLPRVDTLEQSSHRASRPRPTRSPASPTGERSTPPCGAGWLRPSGAARRCPRHGRPRRFRSSTTPTGTSGRSS